jgi:hypothetical protein
VNVIRSVGLTHAPFSVRKVRNHCFRNGNDRKVGLAPTFFVRYRNLP